MIEKILSVKDEVGLHARPASLFVKLAQEFDGTVLVKFNKINKDTGIYCLNSTDTNLQIDHWDKEEHDERKFYHVSYHYQRKNNYWKCTTRAVT